MKNKTCLWEPEGNGCWSTNCNKYRVLMLDDPPTNQGMNYCCYCGGVLFDRK